MIFVVCYATYLSYLYPDFWDTSVVLYQLSYRVNWELVVMSTVNK